MNYKTMLKFIYSTQRYTVFDTEAIYQEFLSIGGSDMLEMGMDPKLPIKKISSTLDSLYRMKFLKRKRVKRRVMTRRGVICNRGYKYMYMISPQGESYLRYLRNPESSLEKRQQISELDSSAFAEIGKLWPLPPGLEPYAHRIHEALDPTSHIESIDRRFPIPHDPSLVILLLRAYREREEWKRYALALAPIVDKLIEQNRIRP